MAAVFYIEYQDGRYSEIEFRTPTMARKAYNLYCKEPEDNAKTYGWETRSVPLTLSQQVRAKRAGK
jgi:hypothetical protein